VPESVAVAAAPHAPPDLGGVVVASKERTKLYASFTTGGGYAALDVASILGRDRASGWMTLATGSSAIMRGPTSRLRSTRCSASPPRSEPVAGA
jgi:hypothetical protein